VLINVSYFWVWRTSRNHHFQVATIFTKDLINCSSNSNTWSVRLFEEEINFTLVLPYVINELINVVDSHG
jgi:hypothetical protein